MEVSPGSLIPLNLQMWDGDNTLYPQAFLFFQNGAPFTTPVVNMTAIGDGTYINNSVLMPLVPLVIRFDVFTDAGHTILDENHTFANDVVIPMTGGGGGTSTSSTDILMGKLLTPLQLKGDIDKPTVLLGSLNPVLLEGEVIAPAVLLGAIKNPVILKGILSEVC